MKPNDKRWMPSAGWVAVIVVVGLIIWWLGVMDSGSVPLIRDLPRY